MKTMTFTFLGSLVCNILVCFGQAGSPDLSFDADGKATSGFILQNAVASANATALQADGKIVVAGYRYNTLTNNSDIALVRYTTSGKPDNSFSGDGVVTIDADWFYGASAIAIQQDGKIVITTSHNSNGLSDFMVLRYKADGTPDNTFDGDGIATTDISLYDITSSIAIQQDGKIIVAGKAYNNLDDAYDFAIVRYNANGTRDSSFGMNGIKRLDVRGSSDDGVQAITVQQDGKILVAGYTDYNIAMVRYNANGTFDNQFGNAGIVITDIIDSYGESVNSLALQQDGKIVIAGYVVSDEFDQFLIARYTANGVPDNQFGNNGIITTKIGEFSSKASSLAIAPDGKIVTGGYTYDPFSSSAERDYILARYNTNGTTDNSFGENGIAFTGIKASRKQGQSMAVQTDGKVVAAGNLPGPGNSFRDIAVIRYGTNGAPDNSFSQDGISTTTFNGLTTNDTLRALAIQPDGKIVVAGSSSDGSPGDFSLARYNPNGSIDLQFIQDFNGKNFVVNSIALQADGKIVAAGSLYNSPNFDFAVVRYKPDGTLDNSFSEDGITSTDFNAGNDVARCVKIQPDGRIVVAGYSYNASGYDFAVARYNSDGTSDYSFSSDGRVTVNILGKNDYAYSLAIQNDGKIVVAGTAFDVKSSHFAVTRLIANGNLDNTFSADGMLITDFGSKSEARCVLVQPDGKIVAAGTAASSTDNDFAVARYNANGTVDNTFNKVGFARTSISANSPDVGAAAALQADGKIIVAGYTYNASASNYDFALVRYTTAGTPDITFGTQGKVLTNFNSPNDMAAAVAVQADGKIVVAGNTSVGTDFDFAIARYNSANTFAASAPYTNTTSSSNIVKNRDGSTALESLAVFPNPVISQASIKFSLPENGLVNIDLLDASGVEIKTIQHGILAAGTRQIEFYRENLPAGIYFLKVQIGGAQATKKIFVK